MASVSVVILNYNGKQYLEKFLPTVIKYSKGYEVVVADNKSEDGSLEFLNEKFSEIKIISFDKNFGFCEGYNKALNQLSSKYFVLLNSDIEVTENWIEPIIDLFEKDEKIAAVQPTLLDYNAKDKFEYAGGAGGFIDKFGYPFCRGRLFDTIESNENQYNDTREIFWASGACMLIRGYLFKKYGGFDVDFFAHMEEIDLCWRMKFDGYKIYHCAESTVYHVGGGTLAYSNPRKTYLNFRNSLLVLLKNLPKHELYIKLPFRWIMDCIAMIKFVLTGDIHDALMVPRAHIFILKNLNKTMRKRAVYINNSVNMAGMYNKFLLFSYHIAGVRKFKDLKF